MLWLISTTSKYRMRETVKANSAGEAILKMESKYIHGKGRLPREWIEVDIDNNWFCQVED